MSNTPLAGKSDTSGEDQCRLLSQGKNGRFFLIGQRSDLTVQTPSNPDRRIMSESNTTVLTARIVAGFLKKNPVAVSDLAILINTVRSALDTLGKAPEPVRQEMKPAVPIRRSVTPDHIVCLEDGKKLKMLKRYLRTTHNLSPDEYRAKWGLPRDYPMVAPNYAAKRSAFAKTIGLGKSRGPAEVPAPVVQDAAAKPVRGRRKAAA